MHRPYHPSSYDCPVVIGEEYISRKSSFCCSFLSPFF